MLLLDIFCGEFLFPLKLEGMSVVFYFWFSRFLPHTHLLPLEDEYFFCHNIFLGLNFPSVPAHLERSENEENKQIIIKKILTTDILDNLEKFRLCTKYKHVQYTYNALNILQLHDFDSAYSHFILVICCLIF